MFPFLHIFGVLGLRHHSTTKSRYVFLSIVLANRESACDYCLLSDGSGLNIFLTTSRINDLAEINEVRAGGECSHKAMSRWLSATIRYLVVQSKVVE